jgi:diguanylate cyclase
VERTVASAIAESIRRAIGAKPIMHGNVPIAVTASIGVATLEPGSPLATAAHLIKAADLAVYNAKNFGRNCVKIFALPKAAASSAAA